MAVNMKSVTTSTMGNTISNPKNHTTDTTDTTFRHLDNFNTLTFSCRITGGVGRNGKYVKKRDDIKP